MLLVLESILLALKPTTCPNFTCAKSSPLNGGGALANGCRISCNGGNRWKSGCFEQSPMLNRGDMYFSRILFSTINFLTLSRVFLFALQIRIVGTAVSLVLPIM